jgi:hypothetical protein
MTILECGNFWLSLGYALGATSISILLFIKKQGACKWFEILTIFLVIISIFIWWKLGNKGGIIACIVTIFIASLPQFIEVTKKPFSTKLITIYLTFGLADLSSFISGKDWSIEERIYPASQLIVGIILISTSIFFVKYKKQRILHWS